MNSEECNKNNAIVICQIVNEFAKLENDIDKPVPKGNDKRSNLFSKLLSVRLVNKAWKSAVDHYFRSLKALTVQVVLDRRQVERMLATDEHLMIIPFHYLSAHLPNEEAMNVSDIAANFERLSQALIQSNSQEESCLLSEAICEVAHGGPLIRLTFGQLKGFIAYISSLLAGSFGVDQFNGSKQYQTSQQCKPMCLQALSLVFIDRLKIASSSEAEEKLYPIIYSGKYRKSDIILPFFN